jgi:hypothetical protein
MSATVLVVEDLARIDLTDQLEADARNPAVREDLVGVRMWE